MDEKRIQKLADYFYGSNDVSGVPLRIMASTGMFSGFDFDKEGFIELMKILQMSENFKKDLINFKEKYGN